MEMSLVPLSGHCVLVDGRRGRAQTPFTHWDQPRDEKVCCGWDCGL